VAGGVAENARGFIDVFVEYQGVAKPGSTGEIAV
jgi:hypothetical protein